MYSDVRKCFGGPHDGVTWETWSSASPIDPTVERYVHILSEDLAWASAYERGPHPITGQPALIYRHTSRTHHA